MTSLFSCVPNMKQCIWGPTGISPWTCFVFFISVASWTYNLPVMMTVNYMLGEKNTQMYFPASLPLKVTCNFLQLNSDKVLVIGTNDF